MCSYLRMRCPSCRVKENWNTKTPDGMGWLTAVPTLNGCCLGDLYLNPWGEESCELFFSCKSSRGMSYAVVASVTLMVFGPRFELGMGEGKERGRDICESYFSTILSHCLFLLLFAVSSFHEFPLFSLLVYILCKQPPCPCELLIKVLQCT